MVFSYGVKPDDVGEKKEEKREEPVQEAKVKLSPMWVTEITALANSAGVDLETIKQQANIKSLDDLSQKAAEMLKKALQRKIMQRRANGVEGQTA